MLCHYVTSVLECPICWGEEWWFCDFLCAVMWGTFPAEHLPNVAEFLNWIYTAVWSGALKVRKHQGGSQHFSEADPLKNSLGSSGLQNIRYYPFFCVEWKARWTSLGCTVRRRGRASPQMNSAFPWPFPFP